MNICNKKFQEDTFQNKTLFESDNFRVIPSLGAMVEGWILLIPKDHYISFSEMDDVRLKEAEMMCDKVYSLLEGLYQSKIVSFENGASSRNNKIGCGVDYAHIHFVPIEIDLKKILDLEYQTELEWKSVKSIQDIKSYQNDSYFYIKNNNNERYITRAINPRSQVIRKGIANLIGVPNQYDWKTHSFHKNIVKTIDSFCSAKTSL